MKSYDKRKGIILSVLHGSCLWGEIQYELSGHPEVFKYCFCPRCQKVSGGAQVANILVDHDQIKWIRGRDNVTRFDLPEAKRFSRGFWKTCGSPVPYILRDRTKVVIPAGSLDDDPGIQPQGIMYWDYRPSWYSEPHGPDKEWKMVTPELRLPE